MIDLHAHSTWSFKDGFGLPEQIVSRCKELGRQVVSITDHDSSTAHSYIQEEATKQGLKMVHGCEMRLVPDLRNNQRKKSHITLLANNQEGYLNLMRLITASFTEEAFYYKPTIDMAMLKECSEGLTVLSGCVSSLISSQILRNELVEAVRTANWFKSVFGDKFYLEIVPIEEMDETIILAPALRAISRKLDIPIVLTNDVHYLRPGQETIWKILSCIRDGTPFREKFDMPKSCYYMEDEEAWQHAKRVLGDFYLEEELYKMFTNQEKIVSDINVTIPKCGEIRYFEGDAYPVLESLGEEGLLSRGVNSSVYRERLHRELDLIRRKGFSDYFLFCLDIVNWARSNRILVGPGRGSAGCSLVAYSLGITDVDPIGYDLVMERFLSEDRMDLPDIDLDFESSRRLDVIRYMREKFGNVAHFINFSTFKGRSTLRDLGKVFEIPMSDIQRVQEVLVERGGADARASFTIADTFSEFSIAKEVAAKYPQILYASQLEGQYRQSGVNAAGIIVSSKSLIGPLSIMGEKEGVPLSSVDLFAGKFYDILKMDILGINELTQLHDMVRDCDVDLKKIEFNDHRVIETIGERPLGIFQFGATGTASIARQIKIDSFEDAILINSLSRPGPLHSGGTQQISRYKKRGDRKHWELPILDKITSVTYGMPVYQEQVLRIMAEIGGMDFENVALIRSAMTKSYGEEYFNKFRAMFNEGAFRLWGIDEEFSNDIFNHTSTFGCLAWNTRICTPEKYEQEEGDNLELRLEIGDEKEGKTLEKRIGRIEIWKTKQNSFSIREQYRYGKWRTLLSNISQDVLQEELDFVLSRYKMKTIEELYAQQENGEKIQVPSVNQETGEISFVEPIAIVYSGNKPTYFAGTTRSPRRGTGVRDRTIRATADHRFLTKSGDWKRLQDLELGTQLYIAPEYGGIDYSHYSSPSDSNKREYLKKRIPWNKGLTKENERVLITTMRSLDGRLKSQNINSWGYGEFSIAEDGHVCQSKFEARFEKWLIGNDIQHVPHPRINGSSRIADYLIGGFYIELDGMEPPRSQLYWEEKYSGHLSNTIVLYPEMSFELLRNKIRVLEDPTPPTDYGLVFEKFGFNKIACDLGEDTYDIIMPPEQPNFIADGFVVHNSYGFNKAHSTAYTMISYFMAYFKTFYSRDFYRVLCNYKDEEKMKALLREFLDRGLGKVLPPKINKSGLFWSVEGEDLRAGLVTVMPRAAAEMIVALYPIKDEKDLEARAVRRIVNARIWRIIEEKGLFSDDDEIDPFGLYKFAERMGYVTDRTHRIGDLGFSFGRRDVVLAGILDRQVNIKSIKELQETVKLGSIKGRFNENAGDAWCLLYLVDETGIPINIHVDNTLYPQIKDWLWSKRVKQDILVVRGYVPSSTSYLIAEELWDWNDQKIPGASCFKCPLVKKEVVPGVGSGQLGLLLVGEAPGFYEERGGKPFVGKAGQLLDEIFEELSIDRNQLRITNACLCRPTDDGENNRVPTPIEIDCCSERLLDEISEFKPKVVIALGKTAYGAITGEEKAIGSVEGTRIDMENFILIPSYHPASCLGGRNPGNRERIKQAIQYALEVSIS